MNEKSSSTSNSAVTEEEGLRRPGLMLSKEDLEKVTGGNLIMGCCTQSCCGGGRG